MRNIDSLSPSEHEFFYRNSTTWLNGIREELNKEKMQHQWMGYIDHIKHMDSQSDIINNRDYNESEAADTEDEYTIKLIDFLSDFYPALKKLNDVNLYDLKSSFFLQIINPYLLDE